MIALSNGSGALTDINRYDEYGIPGSNAGRFQYTGQQWLAELGMYHYRARIYSPTLGRFLQTDPIGFGGGINLYAYVLNDPGNLTDPMGTCAVGGRICDLQESRRSKTAHELRVMIENWTRTHDSREDPEAGDNPTADAAAQHWAALWGDFMDTLGEFEELVSAIGRDSNGNYTFTVPHLVTQVVNIMTNQMMPFTTGFNLSGTGISYVTSIHSHSYSTGFSGDDLSFAQRHGGFYLREPGGGLYFLPPTSTRNSIGTTGITICPSRSRCGP